jgi:hypothetical protein
MAIGDLQGFCTTPQGRVKSYGSSGRASGTTLNRGTQMKEESLYALQKRPCVEEPQIRSPRLGLDPLEIPCSYQPSSTQQRLHTSTYCSTNHPLRLPFNISKYSPSKGS